MSYTTRRLPRAEWAKLAATQEIAQYWSLLPTETHVIVVEDAHQIIGVHAILPVWHLEGLWIAESHRGHTAVARCLWRAVQRELAEMQITRVVTAAVDERVRQLLEHMQAEPLPPHYAFSVES